MTRLGVLFILITSVLQAQNISIIGKQFIANVNSVCEETPDDNPCAGEEIYVVVKFLKDMVELAEKGISSCDKETYIRKFKYNYEIKENDILITLKPEEVEYTHLKEIKFTIENKKLFGAITYPNGKIIVYEFKEE
ncbi:hypothetical protein [uncultured Tenacibaculum sp.]|uniref:hypothetical protein n=1 Tax=uncultured Tenacibaculum sp. TaxID=174713 RepID=UPI0026160273|nr:hypothetical protein [uncultured Tenacibaculum sp.]